MAQRITEGPMARKRRPTPAPVDYEPMNRKPKVTAGQAELGREVQSKSSTPHYMHPQPHSTKASPRSTFV